MAVSVASACKSGAWAAAFATALGLDPAILAQVISSGPMSSSVANSKLAKMANRDFSPHATIRDVAKNAALVDEAAAAAGVDAALLGVARARVETVLAAGGGDLDMAAIISVFATRKMG